MGASLPVYNRVTLQLLRRAYARYSTVVWCVGNWFFGNRDVDKVRPLRDLQPFDERRFLWSHFYPGFVSREMMTEENNAVLVDHAIGCIDFVLAEMPRLKLLFWCLAKRSFNDQGPSQQIPERGLYGAMLKRYASSVLDVLKFHTEANFDQACCRDRSGHPSKAGYATNCQ